LRFLNDPKSPDYLRRNPIICQKTAGSFKKSTQWFFKKKGFGITETNDSLILTGILKKPKPNRLSTKSYISAQHQYLPGLLKTRFSVVRRTQE
jgi:hypothetical protein